MLPITTVDHKVTEWLTLGSLSDISRVQKAAPQLCRRNLPLLHISTQRPGTVYIIARDEFPGLPLC